MTLRAVLPCVSLALVCTSVGAQTTSVAHYVVGGIEVQRWVESGEAKASWQRPGEPLRPLLAPDDRLHFLLQSFDPLAGVPQFAAPLDAPAGTRLRIVQFQTQVLEPYRSQVELAGAEVLHYLPANALFVRCDAAVVPALQALPSVRWVGDLANAFKLDAALRAFLVAGGTAAVECNLVLGRKSDRAQLIARIGGMQAQLVDACDGSVMVRARLTPPQLGSLLDTDVVTWADLAGPDGFDMDHARAQGGADAVETIAGYRGQGVRAEITEPFDETHQDLAGRVAVRGANLATDHGQCAAGIVGGSGAGNAAARGLLPDCDLIEGAYTSATHYAQIQGSVDPLLPWHTMVATASWGAALSTTYNAVSQAMDDALFDSDLTRLNSMSNNGNQTCRPEAWAKNIISVGGVRHLDDAFPGNDHWWWPGETGAASIGPATDGRIKPDMVAYYDWVQTTDLPGTAGFTGTDYTLDFNGTSAATPIVAGYVGLLQQMFTDGVFGNPLPMPATPANRFANKPHMTTSKALVCNTASQYPFVGPGHDLTRTHQGWGFPAVDRAYANRHRMLVVDEYETLSLGQTREYWVNVAPGTPEFRATLTWADPAAQANANIHLVNDLNLKVTRFADGTSWWGNHGLLDGTESTPSGLADDRNTLESVYLSNPQPGAYRIAVEAVSIVEDGKVETPALDVDFALVCHPLGGGSHVDTGLQFTFASSGPGDLHMQCTNVPATGWSEGFTAMSFDTSRGLGFGGFFGLEVDGITGGLWVLPIEAGSAFHFPNAPGTYPFADYVLPPFIVTWLAGFRVDGVVLLLDAGDVVFASNVDRITLQ